MEKNYTSPINNSFQTKFMFKSVFKTISSPVTLIILIILAATAMGVATFIENDFGSQAARDQVYNTKWFELILLLLAFNLIGSIFTRKLYKRQKISFMLFHISFIIMLLGAGITRYFGYEGTMHIREKQSSNQVILNKNELTFTIHNKQNQVKNFSYPVELLQSDFKKTLALDSDNIYIRLSQVHENAFEKAIENKDGNPTIGFVLADKSFSGFAYISKGEKIRLGNTSISFQEGDNNSDILFSCVKDSFYIETPGVIMEGNMNNNDKAILTKNKAILKNKKLYQTKEFHLAIRQLYTKAEIVAEPSQVKNHKMASLALEFEVSKNNETKKLYLWENRGESRPVNFGQFSLKGSIGPKTINLPFSLYLKEFEIERYPGSRSPSSFSSYVTINKEGVEPQPFHIYMNNVLKLEGYRFYQSSYDDDEKGTILSVNHDGFGTTITYIGYFLLLMGTILSIISKNSILRNTAKKLSVKNLAVLLFTTTFILIDTPGFSNNEELINNAQIINKKHAEEYGALLIQDNQGRTKPVYTYASDILRKIARKDRLYGLSPVQIFLEMQIDPNYWMNVPIIKISNKHIKERLNIKGNYAKYTDLVIPKQGYVMQGMVDMVYAKPPAKRNKTDKAIIKIDERVNICYSLFSGSYLRIFPSTDSTEHTWLPPIEAYQHAKNAKDSAFLMDVVPVYYREILQAKKTGDYKQAKKILDGLKTYQQNHATYELPSKFDIKLEITYYKWNLFKKLFPFYSSVGLIFLIVLIISVIQNKNISVWLQRSFLSLILIGFTFHTLGFAMRWYIGGHAPLSNGYESMIFISWVIILAGFIFSKYSPFSIAATAVLGGFTLMVANLSFMDPQITNLVPVLKSYWLTLHVSIITASYGFLGFGAILGLINMILYITKNKSNLQRINNTILSLTSINNKTLILGLYFLTIGTFLGAVWANESWGRYWGWDPKETWSLITILVYTVVTHIRFIPGGKGIFTLNILSVYAFFSVLMTYFGVNYYLSGLHSYAGGDPVPVPMFVYVTIGILFVLTIVSYYSHSFWEKTIQKP